MNDDYKWPIRVVTDCFEDRVSISEGSIKHIRANHPSDTTELHADCLAQVLIAPMGGVYSNPDTHAKPHRLNYYSAAVDTDEGVEYIRVVVDKDECDPFKVITAYPVDKIGLYGKCILEPYDGGES